MNEEFDPAATGLPQNEPSAVQDPVPAAEAAAEVPAVESIPQIPAVPDVPEVPDIPAYQAFRAPEASAGTAAPAAPAPAYQAPTAQTPAYQAPAAQAPAAAQTGAIPNTEFPAAPAAPQPPVYPEAAGPYTQPTQPLYPYGPTETPRAPQEPRPGRKSPYAPMSSFGMAIQIFLMNIPVIGLILSIIWACGVCRKIARRNLARAWLILLILGILAAVALAVIARFCFTDEITRAFEQLFPGYTIKWG